ALNFTMAALASLPTNLKEPLILSAFDGWPQAAIGDFLGISEKAVETRISRARQRLRALLPAPNG
ncbi:MAG: RNA polymerase subunit sigma-24, partial [Anaerolinea sp.]|nr:RNA polymerase subunit sigma-24 [Anaerolinea sp.]